MKIICHRGHWTKVSNQNSLWSIKRSFAYDGVEIDLRSLNQQIVLSHDPLMSRRKYSRLEDAFSVDYPSDFFWALNIKEDGLAPMIKKLVLKYRVKNYMCFDLSFPEQVIYEKLGLKVYLRTGDRESSDRGKDIVFDCFDQKNFCSELRKRKFHGQVMIISPELHQSKHLPGWKILKRVAIPRPMLCTDFPHEAKEFFNEN